jgi:myo-inositol-1(or 4)-monophosphatase
MKDLLDLATRAAAAAAEFLEQGWAQRSVVATKSSSTDIVTQMDRGSESLLVDLILSERPDDSVLGEEGASRSGTSRVTWVLDPLDGTVNYLYGFPSWAVSVAAVIDDQPVVGVVHAPALSTVWRGIAGEFAVANDEPIGCGEVVDLERALVATGFGYDPAVRARQGAIVAELLPQIRDVRRAGAAAVDMCWVAQGVVDAYFERGTHLWDRAAAMAICDGAGARVGGLDGGPATDPMTIAANPLLFEALRSKLVDLGVDDDKD